MTNSLASGVTSIIQGGAHKWWVCVAILFGILLVGIDTTAVNIALPTISNEMRVPVSVSQWVVAAYLITMALSSLPAAGRLADLLGRKTVFLGGFALFILGSASSGLAPNIEVLIAMRVVQAVGGAVLLANSNIIILAVFPVEQHGLAMGIVGSAFSAGYVLGYTLGGWLIGALGWRSVFFVSVPVGIFAIILGLCILVESRLSMGGKTSKSFDFAGMIFSMLAIGCLMVGLEGYADLGSLTGRDAALVALGMISLAIFIVVELRNPSPLLEVRLFHLPVFTVGVATRFLLNVVPNATAFFIPFYVQIVLGFTPLQTGLIMIPFSIALAVLGPMAGGLSDKIGPRWLTTGGLLGSALALLWLSGLKQIPPGESTGAMAAQVAVGMLFLGGAFASFISPNMSMMLNAVPREQTGAASGCVGCLCFLGSAVGTAFSAAMLDRGEKAAGGTDVLQLTLPQMQHAIVSQQTQVFHTLILICLLGAIACFLRGAGEKTPLSPST